MTCSNQLRTTRIERGLGSPEDTFPIPRENAKMENRRGGKVGSSSGTKRRRGQPRAHDRYGIPGVLTGNHGDELGP